MRNGLTESNGMHIVIEDSRKSPSILSNGISIQPGTETNIGLKVTTLSRLKSPFSSECTDQYQGEEMKNINFLTSFEYSSKNCKSWCYIVVIYQKCNCWDLSLMEGVIVQEFVKWSKMRNLTPCEKRNGSSESACVRNLLYGDDQSFLTERCMCHAECKEVEYKVVILK